MTVRRLAAIGVAVVILALAALAWALAACDAADRDDPDLWPIP